MLCSKLTKSISSLIKSLQQKKYRDETDLFVLEGEKSVIELLKNRCDVEYLLCTEEFFEKYPFELERLESKVFIVDKERLSNIGSFKANSAALVVSKKLIFENYITNKPALVIDGLRDPGNFGTIIRTAHWFGIQHIICSKDTVELYNPKVLQACMGSFLYVNIFYTSLVDFLKTVDIPIFGTSSYGENLYETTIPSSAIIIIGSESHGVSENLYPLAKKNLAIPRFLDNIDSLNAAVASGIVCGYWRKNK